MTNLKSWVKQRYEYWLNRRLPVSCEITLTQKRIFILPSKIGVLFMVMLILLLVTGINYQNNLILTVGFLLISVFITSIISTYQNISSLVIKANAAQPVFEGETIHLPLTVHNPTQSNKFGIFIGFPDTQPELIACLKDNKSLRIPFVTNKRGRLKVPRIKLYSQYPVGLLTSWSWLRLEFNSLVYPKPLDKPFRKMTGRGFEDEGQQVNNHGIDEYSGLRRYQKGDNLKRVDWKQYAKNHQLLTKEYHDLKGDDKVLDWYSLAGYPTEERLQILCGWVIKSHENNSEFSLKLPNLFISKSSGEVHFKECLSALALFSGDRP